MSKQLEDSLERPPSVEDCWGDLGRRFVEFARAEEMVNEVALDPEAESCFTDARNEGRGILIATTHLGNWELMAAALSHWGYPVYSIAAREISGPIGRWLKKHRAELGVETTTTGGGARDVIHRLARGEPVALFVDQSTDERSRPIEFFGRPAPTPTTYERLLTLSNAIPILVWNQRRGDGRYTVFAERVPTDAKPLDWLSHRIEQLIRESPRQWIWQHPRWRHRRRMGEGGIITPVPMEPDAG